MSDKFVNAIFIEAVCARLSAEDRKAFNPIDLARKIVELRSFGMSVNEATTAIIFWMILNDRRWPEEVRCLAGEQLEKAEWFSKQNQVLGSNLSVWRN